MTQDIKKDMILHTIGKRLVRNGRTHVRLGAHSSSLTGALRTMLLLLMMVVGVSGVKADDYEGVWYINNQRLPDDGYYFVPTINCFYNGDEDQPHLTTFKTGKDKNSIWRIVSVTVGSDTYYRIIHNATGKYLMANKALQGLNNSNKHRKRVHLETLSAQKLEELNQTPSTDESLFAFTEIDAGNSIIAIKSKNVGSTTSGEGTTHIYLNPRGNGGDDFDSYRAKDGRAITNVNGTVGFWGNDTSSQPSINGQPGSCWKLETATSTCANPVIQYTDASTIQISYPISSDSGWTIYYTTDGSDPASGTPITSTTSISADGVTKVRAIAKKTDWEDSEESVLIASGVTQLVQSKDREVFYMVPPIVEDETNATTTNIPNARMGWSFVPAGLYCGIQYYNIINEETGQYLYCNVGSGGDNALIMKSSEAIISDTYNETIDRAKFRLIVQDDGSYKIISKWWAAEAPSAYYVNKKNGNNGTNALNLANGEDNTALWNVIAVPTDPKTQFDASFASTTDHYKYNIIQSANGTTYHVLPAATDNGNATANTSTDKQEWFFMPVEDSDTWTQYYQIRNGKTGEYLYFNGAAGASNTFFTSSTVEVGNEDRYKFVVVKGANKNEPYSDAYNIIPKALKNQANQVNNSLNRNNTTLRTQNSRNTPASLWNLVLQSPFNCAQPVITWSVGDNGYVITPSESDAKIYYLIGEGELTPSTGTPYTGAISVAELTGTTATIRAIAARSSDGSDASTEASVTVNRVETPVILVETDGTVVLSCATEGASIYYEMGDSPSDPTASSSTPYEGPIEGAGGKFIKAIAVKDGWINSEVATSEQIVFTCATPVIRKTSATTFTIECSFPSDAISDIKIYYNMGVGLDDPTASTGTRYVGPVEFNVDDLPFTVKAIAVATGYNNSEVATRLMPKSITPEDGYHEIANATDFYAFIDMVNIDGADKKYKITDDITVSSPDVIDVPFTGELMGVAKADGTLPVITGMNHAIFNSINGGIVKNVILDNVTISGSGNKGAIANEATGDSRIYNCGVLATGSDVVTDDGYTEIANCSSTIKGSGSVGGIVGLLDGTSRVINCFSYANITGGDYVGGIVGYNNVATNTDSEDTDHYLKTMVMNCMFYGDITGGTSKAPIYNGEIITNDGDDNGVNNFNYFWAGASYVQNKAINVYNCALSAETRYLQRFEFFRHLLNSNRELAAWWATDDAGNKGEMMKWVLEPSQIGTSTPYPILKAPDRYPSVVNIDVNHSNTYKGRDLTVGSKFSSTLSVTIRNSTTDAVYGAPTGADITTTSLNLNITDKDPDHFNFNYGKVQLPYYNDVGTKNYTGNRVVTGWKIVVISGGSNSFSTDNDNNEATTPPDVTASVTDGVISLTNTPYNFADRNCTDKDLYSVSGRVFSQGAYFDVPEGVSAITIEPYWGKAVYLSDANLDVTYMNGTGTNANNAGYIDDAMTTAVNVTSVGGSQHYQNGQKYNLATHSLDETNGQIVYTSLGNAISSSNTTGLFVDIKEGEDSNDHSVYDYAVVLVGNYHHNGEIAAENSKPYTVTSIDLDGDNEPDYSFMLRFNGRIRFHPVRYDFLNLIGLGMAQKTTGGTGTYNFGIMQPKGWFECTNTGLFRVTQFEYDLSPRTLSPIILQGGVMEQWVTHQNGDPANAVEYYHVGGNVWFKEFHIGVHQDKVGDEFVSPHPPISVTGGDFNEFYLTGLYNTPNANFNDNAECYINGGRFGKVAGTGMQGIGGFTINETTKEKESYSNGNIIWQIDNADIDEFYGGGINAAHISEGDIMTVISNSRVDQFCGGPKFGDMNHTTKVVTNADNCTFRTFFGAGYGGNSYNRRYPTNKNNLTSDPDWDSWVSGNEGLRYRYNSDYSGVETRIDYQYIPMSNNTQSVARLFVDYVSFSLATTYDVTSILTDCTITTSPLGRLDLFDQCLGNFYGGGSLGKVVGNVKSTLTNCTVEGNVFGAGYSASLPKVKVMAQSFQNPPRFDNDLGAYLEAELPATTSYDWEHGNALGINTGTKKLITTEDLSKSSLGSINGNVTLTLDGDSKVGTDGDTTGTKGHVYGGGQESYVTGETNTVTVNILGNTEVLGDVFGGGDEGDVEGKTLVNIGEEPTP